MTEMAKISEEASYWLEYFKTHPRTRINSASLMARGVSRRRSLDIIRELTRSGKLTRVSRVYGGSQIVLTEDTTVVPSGYSYIDHSASTAIVPIAVQLEMNNIANKFFDEVKEGEKSMGYEFFESKASLREKALEAALEQIDKTWNREREELKGKALLERRIAAYAEQEAKREARFGPKAFKEVSRSSDPSKWTVRDFVYEFSSTLANIWEIPPADIIRSRFQRAMSAFRQKHNTNGLIEKELMDLFFSSIKAEKYTDGNHVWKAFLYKAPDLLQTARERVITPEQRETDIIDDTARAERKLALFDEDDDV